MGKVVRRVGFVLLLVAAGLYISAALSMPAASMSEPPGSTSTPAASLATRAPAVAALGTALVLLGFGIEALAGMGRRCPRCGAAAVGGSVFCAHHRDELTQAARQVRRERH